MIRDLIKGVIVLILIAFVTVGTSAQERKEVQFNVSGDLVSSYVWRGIYQGAQACVQPTLGMTIGGFSLTAWGSSSLADLEAGHKELDFTLAYSSGNFTIQLADLWWAGQNDEKYFHWQARETGHHLEAGLTYALPCSKFPLSIGWYTVIFGDDRKASTEESPYGKQNYSSYAELNYPFAVRGVNLNATLGCIPYASQTVGMGYSVDGFAITNLALKATKEIRFSEQFSLPLSVQMIFNPAHEKAHLVVGFTLR